jgi:hypothetical protein
MCLSERRSVRYAIDTASADWNAAEAQIARAGNGAGKTGVVSVQSSAGVVAAGRKRKAEGDEGKGRDKKSRRSVKKSKR